MKKNVRNALAISGLALAIGASGFTLEARAYNNSANTQRSHQERILKTRKAEKDGQSNIADRIIISGIVTSISNNSIKISQKNKSFDINVDSDTRLLNKSWETISLAEIKEGHKIRVTGTTVENIIDAKKIRNISIK